MVRREPPQAISERGHVEVDEQADRQLRKAQIGDDLRFVNREQPLDRLEFQEDMIWKRPGRGDRRSQGVRLCSGLVAVAAART